MANDAVSDVFHIFNTEGGNMPDKSVTGLYHAFFIAKRCLIVLDWEEAEI